MTVTTSIFGHTKQGETVTAYRVENRTGMQLTVLDYGATIQSLRVPDRRGELTDVVLGYDTVAEYEENGGYLGATIGRVGNRIGGAEFSLNGKTYPLAKNDGENHLHGGIKGFDKQMWNVEVREDALVCSRLSPDGEEGYPGNLWVRVTFTLHEANALSIQYEARAEKDTLVNLTNHSYFNLTGCKEPVLNHLYTLHADSITPVDSTGVPTGELKAVTGTEYDFRTPRTAEKQIRRMMGKTYDINYKLNKHPDSLELVATVTEPVSGRILKAYTTEPGMQFYIPSSNMDYLNGHGNRKYGKYYGFCLEMQHFPDSPNKPQFPSTVLRPGEIYRQTTIYKFENSPATKCHLRIKSVPPPY